MSQFLTVYQSCSQYQVPVYASIPIINEKLDNARNRNLFSNGESQVLETALVKLGKKAVKTQYLTLASLLRRCGDMKNLSEGKRVHDYIKEMGLEGDTFIGNHLLDMYRKCGNLPMAWTVFDSMPNKDIASWTSIIGIYAQHGEFKLALRLFCQMRDQGVQLDKITLVSILSVCQDPTALADGKLIHALILDNGFEGDLVTGNALVNMYANCQTLLNAWLVFQSIPQRDVISWTIIAAGYLDQGQNRVALYVLKEMHNEGVMPDMITFITILNTCATDAKLAEGKMIHAYLICGNFKPDVVIHTALMNMYGKCGSPQDAYALFQHIHLLNVVSYNTMISVYAGYGLEKEAIELYQAMYDQGLKPSKITFITTLKACSGLMSLASGKFVHACIIIDAFPLDLVLENALINTYGKCGCIFSAYGVFVKMQQRDVISWSTLIFVYDLLGKSKETLGLFQQMHMEGIMPNKFTFVSLLCACSNLENLGEGKHIHACVIAYRFQEDVVVESSLVDLYGKCGDLESACRCFVRITEPNVISCTAVLAAYVHIGYGEEAFHIFKQMSIVYVKANQITYMKILSSFSSVTLSIGKMIHAHALQNRLELIAAIGNCLLNMYGRAGSLEDACKTFVRMYNSDSVSWNAMIATFSQHGHAKAALILFWKMYKEGMMPNRVAFVSVFDACTTLYLLIEGMLVHSLIIDSEVESDIMVQTSLVTMYSKCGCLHYASRVFERMHERNLAAYNAMLAACSQHGDHNKSISLFQQMRQDGVEPDDITFVSFFSACSHMGLIDKCFHFITSLCQDHGIIPTPEHYGSILGHPGFLDEAVDFIQMLPGESDSLLWMTLLGGCKTQGKV